MISRRDALLLLAAAPAAAADFASRWPSGSDQVWLGPEYWANRLQDWRLHDGCIECIAAGGDRNVVLLTHELSVRAEPFETSVNIGPLDQSTPAAPGFAGFRVGMRGPFDDYRDTAIYGIGLDAGLSSDGRLFIGDLDHASSGRRDISPANRHLVLRGQPQSSGYELTLVLLDASRRPLDQVTRSNVAPEWVAGGLALVCSSGPILPGPDPRLNAIGMSGIERKGRENSGDLRFWFTDWSVAGPKLDFHRDRSWGPVLFAMHTLSGNVLKLTAQMAPVNPVHDVRLELLDGDRRSWRIAGKSAIDPLSRTATFRIPNWDDSRDVRYRLVWPDGQEASPERSKLEGHVFEGTVRRDPKHRGKLVAAALSCMNDLGFPHSEIVRNLTHHKPDILLFLGDQIYEHSASYGVERLPLERAALDYLRKWYLFGWTYRDLLCDTPAVCMPDDHDVYHGNVWGAGGRRAEGGFDSDAQDNGGYVEPAEWVNMMQRTQTSHLPDPFDPAPVLQGIGVYYTELRYGGVSFAILEDRKWKSSPKTTLPDARVVNGWAQNPNYRAARDGDVPGAQLLGPRQMKFLEHWASDWHGVWMKAVLSQTLFANVATLPPPANGDDVTTELPILPPGGYAEGEVLVSDHDSNGWPQTPRNQALRLFRRALAVHICGDQHLGSTVQYGIDDWNDASWAVCTPAVSNLFPRRWFPPHPGNNPNPASPRNTGEYTDGFGNRVTVHAVFNPQVVEIQPTVVNHRAPGYTIVEFDRETQATRVANWPRWQDASQPGARPCPGWPIVVHQRDNGLTGAAWQLDRIERGQDPLTIEIHDQSTGEHVYTYRMVEKSFAPRVFRAGRYRVRLRDSAGAVIGERENQIARKVGSGPKPARTAG